MLKSFSLAIVSSMTLASAGALGQQAAHVAEVAAAQAKSYAIADSTNKCPPATKDVLGWSAGTLRRCVYDHGNRHGKLTGVVYLLHVEPGVVANWIETSCQRHLPGAPDCFRVVLTCANMNSSMMFAVSGNIIEIMDENKPPENYFFRNGMTVATETTRNGSTGQIGVLEQENMLELPNSAVTRIPSGNTRFWRTNHNRFADAYKNEDIPKNLDSGGTRQKWLDVARIEMQKALTSSENRLLDAWVKAQLPVIRGQLGAKEISESKCTS